MSTARAHTEVRSPIAATSWAPQSALSRQRPPSGVYAAGAVLGIVAMTIAGAVLGLESRLVDRPVAFVALRTTFCLGVAAIALVLRRRGVDGRLTRLLIAIGYAMTIAGLTNVDASVPFALGRIAVPIALLLLMYFCLAFPAGYINVRRDSRGFAAAASAIIVLDLGNVLCSSVSPVAGPFVRCVNARCPPNPFNLVSAGVTLSSGLSTLLGLITAVAVFGAAAAIGQRAARASRLQRRSLAPLFAWTILAALGYGSFLAVRALDDGLPQLGTGALIVAAIIASMPIAIGLGLARGRLFSMRALETMVANLAEHTSLRELERTMSRAFADPSLQVLLWQSAADGYVDTHGHPADVDGLRDQRAITEFTDTDEKAVAVLHDPALTQDRDVLEAAGHAIRLALQNARLEEDLSNSIAQMEAAAKRVAHAAEEERRRIEHDLHDGAQQVLVGVRIKLSLLEELMLRDPVEAARGIADAGRRINAALQDIRDLASGIYPPVLRDLGIAQALRDVALRMPVEVHLHDHLRRRFAPEIETAVYFCCLEALQNVAKHCGAGTRATVRLTATAGRPAFTVTDDGPGFDPALVADAHGITGMRDRLTSIGGELTITSAHAKGTTVTGHFPASLDPRHRDPADRPIARPPA